MLPDLDSLALFVRAAELGNLTRAAEAGLGVGVLPLAAARGFSGAMGLKVLPLSDDWAARHMQLVTRCQPPSQTPLGTLVAHLEGLAAERPAA